MDWLSRKRVSTKADSRPALLGREDFILDVIESLKHLAACYFTALCFVRTYLFWGDSGLCGDMVLVFLY